MRAIVTGDLHLDERKENEYRFEIFNYLQTKQFDVLVIAGDLTDSKDRHCGILVNRIVDSLMRIADHGVEVHVLMGNHDYSDDLNFPFFLFLKYCPNCYYHHTSQIWEIGNMRWAFFPHSRDPSNYWKDIKHGSKNLGVDVTVCHQVFSGATIESGKKLLGHDSALLNGAGKILSGDVHVPQIIGPIEYVGSPYPINFGDAFEPRMVLFDSNSKSENLWSYLYPPTIQKLVLEVSDPEQIEYQPYWREGDQVKVVLSMKRSDFGSWEAYRKQVKKICDRNHLMLRGLKLKERVRQKLTTEDRKVVAIPMSYREQFTTYCNNTKVDKSDVKVGRELLESK